MATARTPPKFRAMAVVSMDRRLNPDPRPIRCLSDHKPDAQVAILTGWHWASVIRACQDWLKPIS